jgi:hypothetical protein
VHAFILYVKFISQFLFDITIDRVPKNPKACKVSFVFFYTFIAIMCMCVVRLGVGDDGSSNEEKK